VTACCIWVEGVTAERRAAASAKVEARFIIIMEVVVRFGFSGLRFQQRNASDEFGSKALDGFSAVLVFLRMYECAGRIMTALSKGNIWRLRREMETSAESWR
jgi:hypothetical protein